MSLMAIGNRRSFCWTRVLSAHFSTTAIIQREKPQTNWTAQHTAIPQFVGRANYKRPTKLDERQLMKPINHDLVKILHTFKKQPQKMKEICQKIDTSTVLAKGHIIVKWIGLLLQYEQVDKAIQIFRNNPIRNQRLLSLIIRSIGTHGSPEFAMEFLDYIEKNDIKILRPRGLHSSIIMSCARAPHQKEKFFVMGYNLIKKWINEGLELKSDTVVATIALCSSVNRWSIAEKIIDQCSTYDDDVKSNIYESAILSCRGISSLEFQKKLFFKMLKETGTTTTHVCDMALTNCAQEYNYAYSKEVVKFMNAKKIPMSVVTVNCLLALHGKKYDMNRILSLFEYIRNPKKSIEVAPDIYTFNTVLSGCFRCRKPDVAISIFSIMEENNVQRDIITYNIMIKIYGRVGDFAEIMKIFSKVEDIADNYTYENIAEAYFYNKEYQNVIDFWKKNQACSSAKMLNFLVSSAENLGDYETAKSFVEQFKHHQKIHSVTYNHVLGAFIKGNALDEGLAYYAKICDDGFLPSTYTFTLFMEELFNQKRYEDVMIMFKEFEYNRANFFEVNNFLHFPSGGLRLIAVDALYELNKHECVIDMCRNIPAGVSSTAKLEMYKKAIFSCEQLDDCQTAVELYDAIYTDLENRKDVYDSTIRTVAKTGQFQNALDVGGGRWYRDTRE